jgi:hypothetical protein
MLQTSKNMPQILEMSYPRQSLMIVGPVDQGKNKRGDNKKAGLIPAFLKGVGRR